jgi:adenylate kinase
VNIKKILREGQLVDDKLVVDIVNKIRTEPQFSKHMGLIFDGVPRTRPQARMMKQSGVKIDLIINFFNREEILLQKLMSRRVCPCCGKNYNIADINTPDGYQMKPLLPKKKVDECDDHPGVKLVIREDDNEAVIRDRMKVYESKTVPILEFYKNQ